VLLPWHLVELEGCGYMRNFPPVLHRRIILDYIGTVALCLESIGLAEVICTIDVKESPDALHTTWK